MRAVLLAGVLLVSVTACDFILPPTKMAKGELYQSGENKYDPYFASVHQEQTAAAQWPEEAKTSRKAIVTALSLSATASNSRILSAARDHRGDAALAGPIDQTTSAEIERTHHLTAFAAKLDELKRQGEDLKRQATEERQNLGANKADPTKRDKADEVKREVSAAVGAVDDLASDARKGAHEAEDLAVHLKAAWTGNRADERPVSKAEPKKDDAKKDEPKEEPKPEKKAPPKKPHKKPGPKPDGDQPAPKPAEDKPAPKPKPQQPPDEVFNP